MEGELSHWHSYNILLNLLYVCWCLFLSHAVFLFFRLKHVKVVVFRSVLVCYSDLCSHSRFMTFQQRYATDTFIYIQLISKITKQMVWNDRQSTFDVNILNRYCNTVLITFPLVKDWFTMSTNSGLFVIINFSFCLCTFVGQLINGTCKCFRW